MRDPGPTRLRSVERLVSGVGIGMLVRTVCAGCQPWNVEPARGERKPVRLPLH
jgi:hypothetical protein